MEDGADDNTLLIYIVVIVLLFIGACWAFGFGKILTWIFDLWNKWD